MHVPLIALAAWIAASPAFAVRPLTPAAPEFPKDLAWLNSEELSLKRLSRRRMVLVTFINANSLNSIRTFPVLKAWWERYSLDGLMIIGVHTPDLEMGRDPSFVRKILKRYDLRFPVVLDNERHIWNAYKNEGWPVHYLIDTRGRIIFDRLGEGGYQELETEIRRALHRFNGFDPPEDLKLVADLSPSDCGQSTPQLHVGTQRGKQTSLEGVKETQRLVVAARDGEIAYRGRWALEPEGLRLLRDNPGFTDFVRLVYRGAEGTALLAAGGGHPVKVFIKQEELWLHSKNSGRDVQWDEDDRSFVMVFEPRIYYLTKNPEDNAHELYLYPSEAGVAVHGFDFSNSCQSQYERK